MHPTMTRNLTIVLLVAIGLVAVPLLARAVTDGLNALPLATDPHPPVPGDDGHFYCRLAAIEGTLTTHPDTGLGLGASTGSVAPIVWPYGWRAARAEDGRIALLNEDGEVVAHTGDYIAGAGGQSTYEDITDAFAICSLDIEVERGAS